MRGLRTSTAVLLALAAGSHGAWAQRAADNAVSAAQDAFGTSVGNENIGLYSASNARGFSPTEAGNLRIEGLYFDQQINLGNRLVRGSTIRVGLSAQSYPFPAPTGIADYQLRLPGEQTVISTVGTYSSEGTYRLEVDSQLLLAPERLGLTLGASAAHDVFPPGNTARTWNAGAIFRWHPTDEIEIIPFWGREQKTDWETNAHRWFPAPGVLPYKATRGVYVSQDWADWTQYDTNFGLLARYNLGDDWVFRAGAFRSVMNKLTSFISFFRNSQPDGSATLSMISNPPQANASYSGEVRASRVFREGPRRHTIHLAARGRDTERQFGGGSTYNFGAVQMGVNKQFAPPAFVFGPESLDHVKQTTGGVSYEGLWSNVGELSAGLQKTFVRRKVDQPGLALRTSRDNQWLYNGTLAVYPSKDLAVYVSYTRGLEEAGIAPETAANYGEPQPANITKQIDAGVRYALTPNLRLVAGVFEVSKPYLNRNTANIFTTVGTVKNQGIELSLSGPIAPGLRMVAGGVLIKPRASGLTVDQGLIGRIPSGEIPHTLRLNLQYGPASWKGFSIDGQVVNQGAAFADRLDTYKIPSSTVFDVGTRYQFKVGGIPASVRLQVTNIANNYSFTLSGSSGTFMPTLPRRFSARVSADF